MLATGFIDLLLVIAAIALSWRMYAAAQPPPDAARPIAPERAQPAPIRSAIPAALPQRLQAICTASGIPGIEQFLEGAKAAHEAIVIGFARGELAGLLLAADVRDVMDAAIAQRQARGETVTLTLIGTPAAEIADAAIEGRTARIEVRFTDLLASVTRDSHGEVVAGHPAAVGEVMELWTFERNLDSADPNWTLAATGPAEAEAA